jgi:hypothetical protein
MTIVLGLALGACGPGGRGGDDGGDDGGTTDAGNTGGGDGGNNGDGCSDAAKLVYVVDQNKKLSQFNPMTKSFTDLGTLTCPAAGGATPFSMGIDRDALAWVLYSNGELFRVETKNNLACTKASWIPNTQGHQVFGMGFSTDAAGGTTDSLFIAGGAGPGIGSTSTLARLDIGTFQPNNRGTLTGWPELTGTGNAELWGFFPQSGTTGARIAKLDKTTGAALQTFPETSLNDPLQPLAWAFAFHGGSFWVFLKKSSDSQTQVYQFNASDGAMVGVTPSGGRTIVGAGVSTCAPVIL